MSTALPGPAATGPAATGPRATGPGRHRREGGERTRADLMDGAEELFAASGVEAVSIRSVNVAAGVAPASVHYHFGDKETLVRAVIARRGEAVVARQEELLPAVEATARPTAEDVVRLLAVPFYELLQREPIGGRRWLTIIANLVATGNEQVYQVGFGPGSVQQRINACAAAAYPEQPGDFVAARWLMASTTLLQLLAGSAGGLPLPASSAEPGDEPGPSADRILTPDEFATIVTFVATGFDGVCRGR
jgi:AcrR family transcriptional regulator